MHNTSGTRQTKVVWDPVIFSLVGVEKGTFFSPLKINWVPTPACIHQAGKASGKQLTRGVEGP